MVLYGLQVSTYQAASGAGQAAMDELEQQTREVLAGEEVTTNIFPFQARICPPRSCLYLAASNAHTPSQSTSHQRLRCTMAST